jgi:hypothetical protein
MIICHFLFLFFFIFFFFRQAVRVNLLSLRKAVFSKVESFIFTTKEKELDLLEALIDRYSDLLLVPDMGAALLLADEADDLIPEADLFRLVTRCMTAHSPDPQLDERHVLAVRGWLRRNYGGDPLYEPPSSSSSSSSALGSWSIYSSVYEVVKAPPTHEEKMAKTVPALRAAVRAWNRVLTGLDYYKAHAKSILFELGRTPTFKCAPEYSTLILYIY